jgi:hypothetical protein
MPTADPHVAPVVRQDDRIQSLAAARRSVESSLRGEGRQIRGDQVVRGVPTFGYSRDSFERPQRELGWQRDALSRPIAKIVMYECPVRQAHRGNRAPRRA